MMARPILRTNPRHKQNQPQARRNDYTPGYVYVMLDRAAGLTKIGLSWNPEKRRYYLSRTYNSELKILAKSWTFNMKMCEQVLHKHYRASHTYREYGKDGFTEWFAFNGWQLIEVKFRLFATANLINAGYVAVVLLAFAILAAIVFR